MIGCLPQQLISESLFNHVLKEDQAMLRKAFQESIANPKLKIRSAEYRFRYGGSSENENGNIVVLQSTFLALQNPHSAQIEYVVAVNRLVSSAQPPVKHNTTPVTFTLSSALSSSLLRPLPPPPPPPPPPPQPQQTLTLPTMPQSSQFITPIPNLSMTNNSLSYPSDSYITGLLKNLDNLEKFWQQKSSFILDT